jgi:hypothetical protein
MSDLDNLFHSEKGALRDIEQLEALPTTWKKERFWNYMSIAIVSLSKKWSEMKEALYSFVGNVNLRFIQLIGADQTTPPPDLKFEHWLSHPWDN